MDTYYKERSNGRWSYWTYSEGIRVFVSESLVKKDLEKGVATLIYVK